MEIKILGTGCAKCNMLEEHVREAVKQMELDIDIIKVTNIEDIIEYDIMGTPALVVDEKVIISGRVPSVKKIITLLK